MGTSRQDILRWLDQAKAEQATHMIVACDTFDWDDYPVNVLAGKTVAAEIDRILNAGMQKIMEVYSLALDIEMQLNEFRAFHPE